MHVEFLVEEESAEIALYNLVPKIVGAETSFDIHVFQGKHDLLSKLPDRLTGYSRWIPDDWHIVVLVDEDRGDCHSLKGELERAAGRAGLYTRSMVTTNQTFQVLNRLAIEELEAWFFGDIEALVQAYPRIPPTLNRRRGYRDPDAIRGGTWEALERVFKKAGYFTSGMPKIEVARTVSTFMNPDRNSSRSFQVFKNGLRDIIS
jgi:hypothetical protein